MRKRSKYIHRKTIYLHCHEKNGFFMDLKGEQEERQGTADLSRESRAVSLALQSKALLWCLLAQAQLNELRFLMNCCISSRANPRHPEQLLGTPSCTRTTLLGSSPRISHKLLQVEPHSCSASLPRAFPAGNATIPTQRH